MRNNSRIEIEIKPIPPEASIYGSIDGIFQPKHSGNYKVTLYNGNQEIDFKMNNECYQDSIRNYFLKIPIIKEEYRNRRLSKFIKED